MTPFACLRPDVVALLERHQLLLPLLRAEVIDQALSSIVLEPAELEQLLSQWRQQNQLEADEQLQAWLQQQRLTQAEWLHRLSRPVRLARLLNQEYASQAEARFLERKQQLDQVVYSLIRVKDPFKARELYLRIAEGEAEFGALAAQHSEGKEQQTRGVIGPVPLVQAHPHLVQVLRSSSPGELREPLQIEGWTLIVRLESHRPAVFDEAMRQRMAQELFEQWVEQETRRTLETLVTQAGDEPAAGHSSTSP
jgi:parvulin-like peptidyl-prolyl isomerase